MSDERDTGMVKDTYPLIPPFAYALIQTDPKTNQTKYSVMEAPLNSKEEKVLAMIKDVIVETLDLDFTMLKGVESADYLRTKVIAVVKDYGIKLDEKTFEKLFYHIKRDFIGLGIIEPVLQDKYIEDISCNGTGVPIFVWHREYESIESNLKFNDANELDSFIVKIAQRCGRHISVANPLLDASLPDGSRVQLTFGKEVTQHGSTFTIRKFRADPLTITDLVTYNTLDEEIAAYFWFAMENRNSILIAGGTAAGKTSLLNSLAMFIRPGLKIVSIEDTAELNIPHDNWIPSVARGGFGPKERDGSRRGEISLFDLLKASLRQRPDFIFVGEVRGSEAYNLFQAMATGHAGMGTIHGDSVVGVIRRLESEPMSIPKQMMQSLNIICVQRKVRRGTRQVRRTVEVMELVGIDSVTNNLITNKVFAWDPRDDVFINYGRSYVLEDIQAATGMSESQVLDELERRKAIISWLVKKKLNNFKEVTQIIQDYYVDPDQTYDRAKQELRNL